MTTGDKAKMDNSEKEYGDIVITIEKKGNEYIVHNRLDKYETLQLLGSLEKRFVKMIEDEISNSFTKSTGHTHVTRIFGTQDVKTGEITKRYNKD
jgi:hypothetical protein